MSSFIGKSLHVAAVRTLLNPGFHPHFPFSSVQFSHSVISDSLRSHELQDARPPCPSPSPRVHSNSHPFPLLDPLWDAVWLFNPLLKCDAQAEGEEVDRGWDGGMASPNQWTWIRVNSRSWWWTGRPGILQFMGSQRVGHDWVTKLNWTECIC